MGANPIFEHKNPTSIQERFSGYRKAHKITRSGGQETSPDVAVPRVALLDSDEKTAFDFEKLLMAMGHEVLVLDRVIGASNRIREYGPDILVVDICSPTIYGEKLIDVLRANLKDFPVLILFSRIEKARLASIAEATGADDYVVKNGDYTELVNRIRFYANLIGH